MVKPALVAFGLIVFTIILQANPAHAGQDMLLYHGKNVVESPPQFAGTVMHFMMNGDKATVIACPKGMEVIRMDIRPSDTCIQTQSTLCFDGKVTDDKNPQIHHVGDEVSFSLDFANKKQIGVAKSGVMQGTTVTMNIEKMSLKSNSPYTISVSREGGFASLQPKIVTFDSTTNIITLSDRGTVTNSTILDSSAQEINRLVQKGNLLNIAQNQYAPHPGAADYFTYHLTLDQGIFHREFTWTDASDAPKLLSQVLQSLMFAAQPDQ